MNAALLALLLAAGAHPQSQSSSLLEIRGAHLALTLRCQAAALIEALGGDADEDGRLDQAELDAARGAIEEYVAARYLVRLDSGGDASRGRLLSLASTGLRPIEVEGLLGREAWVELGFAGQDQRAIGALLVEVSLFGEANPLHRDTATVVWNGEAPAVFLAGPLSASWYFQPVSERRPGVVGAFFGQGIDHILTGWDHLAFLLALLLASRGVGSLVGTITAFTAAHSITLALAAFDLVHIPSRPVELLIALSIAYVGLENLLAPRSSARWIEACAFGLAHGLGFAGFLAQSLVAEPLELEALVGFNLGVEAGQLAVVAPLALVLRLLPDLPRRASPDPGARWLAPAWARSSGSAVIAVLGLYWFAQRAGWL